jgi:hypothetical protein
MTDEIEEFDDGDIEVFSVKLINGIDVLAELYTLDEKNQHIVTMVTPMIVVQDVVNGNQSVYAKEYDCMTDMDEFDIDEKNFLSEPSPVSDFYRLFYAKALLFSFIKNARSELPDMGDMDEDVVKTIIENTDAIIKEYVVYLEERYDVGLSDDTPPPPEKNILLH